MTNRILLLLSVLVTAGTAWSQAAPDAAKPRPKRPQVVIVGASVSGGFADPTSKGPDGEVNRTFKLDAAFKKTIWPSKQVRVRNFANLAMFQNAERHGARQIKAARKVEPDLLIGVDFLAWFGMGAARDRLAGKKVDKIRLAQLEKGLKLLEDFPCPVVIGDFPDMSNASTHMLPKYMVPNQATLQALNKRVVAWAAQHKNIHVMPIAKFVKEAVEKQQTYPWGKDRRVVLPKNFLLQSDRLHATRLGTLVIVLRIHEMLPRVLPKQHSLLRPDVTFKGLVESAGVEDQIPQPVKVK